MTLVDALAEWARTPHPLIANAIDALSEKALETYVAPNARTKESFHGAWLECARNADAVTIGWLARTLREKLEVRDEYAGFLRSDYARTKYATWFERLEALAPYASDPRVSSSLCSVFEDMPYSVWDVRMTAQVYEPAATMLTKGADTRVVARLRAALANPKAVKQVLRETSTVVLPGIIEVLARLPIHEILDEARWRAVDDRVVPVVVAASQHEPQLLAQALTDASARQIYADALLERGDARGEFIALQLDGSEKARRSAGALLKQHGAEWLGPLHQVLRGVVFERGFLVEAELAQNAAATAEVWAEAARDSRLSTVRALRKGRGSAEHLHDFYRGGALRALRCFEVPNHDSLQHLPAFNDTVREVVLFERFSLERAGALAELSLEALTVIGNGKKLSQWIDALERHGLLSRLKRLTCLPSHSTPYAEALLDKRAWANALECFEVRNVGRLRRTGGTVDFDFSSFGAEDALPILQRLPATVRRVRCSAFHTVLPLLQMQLIAAAGSRGVTIEQLDAWPRS